MPIAIGQPDSISITGGYYTTTSANDYTTAATTAGTGYFTVPQTISLSAGTTISGNHIGAPITLTFPAGNITTGTITANTFAYEPPPQVWAIETMLLDGRRVRLSTRRDERRNVWLWEAWVGEQEHYQREVTDAQLATQSNEIWERWVGQIVQQVQAIGTASEHASQQIAYAAEQLRNTTEQVQQNLREQRERQARVAQERSEDLVQARERARALLLEILDEDQEKSFVANGHFEVQGRSGKRYRLKCGLAHNVHELDDRGKHVYTLCAHVDASLPHEDNMAAQALRLVHDEDGFLAIANRSRAMAA